MKMMQRVCSFGLKSARIRTNQMKNVCISNRRSFCSSINGGNNQKDKELNDQLRAKVKEEEKEMHPLELLMQHAAEIRAMNEKNEVDIDKLEFDVGENEEEVIRETDEKEEEGDDDDDADDDDEDEDDEEEEEEEEEEEDAIKVSSSDHSSSKRKKPKNRRKGFNPADRLKKRIAFDDTIDFEHGLRDMERSNQDKKIMRHIRRTRDAERVCSNCGEVGHINKYCPLPRICRHCGDIGHEHHECPHQEAQKPKAQKKVLPKDKAQETREAMDKEIDEYLASLDQHRKKQ